MPTKDKPTSKYTKEQKDEYKTLKRQEAKEKLEAAVSEIKTSKGWHQWLRTRASFHKYSLTNTLLIALQTRDWDPQPSQIAGAKKWMNNFERQITAGQKALRIFAPVMVDKKGPDGEKVFVNGKPVKVVAFYKLIPVFDVSQTEGPDLPGVPYVSIEGDDHIGLLVDIDAYADKSGTPIKMDDSISVNANVRQAVRQIAANHAALLNPDKDATLITASEREIITEAITFIVLSGLGFDASPESVPHIAAWQNGETETDALRTFAGYIDREASEIERLLGVRS